MHQLFLDENGNMEPQDLTALADLDYAQVEHQDLFLFGKINF